MTDRFGWRRLRHHGGVADSAAISPGLHFKSRARLEAEVLLLRQQLNVLGRWLLERPHITKGDRLLFVWPYRLFPFRLKAIRVVWPEMVLRRLGQGLRAYWALEIARSRPVSGELCDLIRQMSLLGSLRVSIGRWRMC